MDQATVSHGNGCFPLVSFLGPADRDGHSLEDDLGPHYGGLGMNRYVIVILLVALGYIIGAKMPGLAQKIGIA